MLITAIWSLVAAPALCRTDALTACCAHDAAPPSQAQAQAVATDCCPCDQPSPTDEPATPAPPPRQCGSCADVCRGAAKPDRAFAELAAQTHTWAEVSSIHPMRLTLPVADAQQPPNPAESFPPIYGSVLPLLI